MGFPLIWRSGFVAYFLLLSWQLLTPVTIVSAGSWDKLLHFAGFFVLGALGKLAAWHTSMFKLALSLVAYAVLTEILQHFIPGRSFSMLDWAADALGIGFALLLSTTMPDRIPFSEKADNKA